MISSKGKFKNGKKYICQTGVHFADFWEFWHTKADGFFGAALAVGVGLKGAGDTLANNSQR